MATETTRALGIEDSDEVVRAVVYLFDFLLVIMALSFFITLIILVKNRLFDKYYARIYKRYMNLVVHHMVDEDEVVPPPDIVDRRIVRDVIIDLVFITKGPGVQTLKKLYTSFGLYQYDIQLLRHRSWHKRLAAIVRLDQWKSPLPHRDLVLLMDDENKEVRIHAMKALSLSTEGDIAIDILNHLKRTRIDLSIRYECLSRLLRVHRDLILNTLRDQSWSEIHPHIIKVLGDQRDILAVPFIMDAAGGSNAEAREAAYFALGKIGDPRGISVLLNGLDSDSGQERLAAVKALHLVDEDLFRNHVGQLRNDPDPLVRGWTHHLARDLTP